MPCFLLTEVKKLKQLVRNVIDPDRDLGHVDRNHYGKKPGSTSDQQSTSRATGQSSTGKAQESIQHYYRSTSTNISKAPIDDQEQTIPTDADAAVARGTASEENENSNSENPKDESPVGGEACEDCK